MEKNKKNSIFQGGVQSKLVYIKGGIQRGCLKLTLIAMGVIKYNMEKNKKNSILCSK